MEKEYSWVKYIKGRINQRKNFLGLISGPTGSGKSWTAISMALMLDPTFNAKRIIFSFRNLMELINSSEKFSAGTVFMWDETQVDASSRAWQSLTNRLLNSLLSTFRHRNFILLITSPYADFLDSQARKLLHADFQTMKINFSSRIVRLKPHLIQYNPRNKKFYYKYLRVSSKNGPAPVIYWDVPAPPKWIIEDYEELKMEFTSKLNKDIERQLTNLEKAKDPTKLKPLTEIQEQVLELYKKHKDSSLVAVELSKTPQTINFHLRQIKKKGYSIIEDRREGKKDGTRN